MTEIDTLADVCAALSVEAWAERAETGQIDWEIVRGKRRASGHLQTDQIELPGDNPWDLGMEVLRVLLVFAWCVEDGDTSMEAVTIREALRLVLGDEGLVAAMSA